MAISQFTLYADVSGGNRPSFINAADQQIARDLYNLFVDELKKSGIKISTGKFGEYMQIDNELDGPVTILIESSDF